MAARKPRVGFVGYGEAATRFAHDLKRAGVRDIAVYSRSIAKASEGDPARKRAAAAGVHLAATPRELCERSDIIIALTPGRTALAALRSLRPYLRADQLYVDASAAAVKTMEEAGRMLEGRARFVDAAIMSPVPLNGIKGVIVASGAHAKRFHALMTPFGMNIQIVGDKPGAASAMKLIRSVCIKGLSAVMLECFEAAQRYGVLDAVAADIAGSLDERPFAQNMKRYVCGTAVHAARRVHEMTDSLTLLRALGASTRMTRATRAMLIDIEKMGLREKFNAREPDSIAPVMRAIIDAKR